MPQSLFGHLAHNFSSHPENLATEALAFILGRSHVAADAFIRLLHDTGAPVPSDLRFQTQAAGVDGAIPDLVGISPENTQPVICEAKFWAGLTDNQPVTYLRRLPEAKGGLVIFLAPAKRLPSLWPELLRRCSQAGLSPDPADHGHGEMLVARLSAGRYLVATSWRLVLNTIRHALETEGELETAADVRQLEGLCDRMDSEAFLPLRSEELSPTNGARILQFNDLVDDLTSELVETKVASIAGVRATPTTWGYIRYMAVGSYGWILQVNAHYWASLRDTPIWLGIKAVSRPLWIYSPGAYARLARLEHETPSRLLRDEDMLLVPLFMPLGMDRQGVMGSLRAQLHEIIAMLTPSEPASGTNLGSTQPKEI